MTITDLGHSKSFQKILTKQGFKFKLNTKVTSLKREGDTVTVEIESAKDGKKDTVSWARFWRTLADSCVDHIRRGIGRHWPKTIH